MDAIDNVDRGILIFVTLSLGFLLIASDLSRSRIIRDAMRLKNLGNGCGALKTALNSFRIHIKDVSRN